MPNPYPPAAPLRSIHFGISKPAIRAAVERALTGPVTKPKVTADRASSELFFTSMETESDLEAIACLLQALELDPGNTDVILMPFDDCGVSGDKRFNWLRRIVEIAAERLGEKAFRELVPHFWGFHETRSYMIARGRLADELCAAGRLEEAVVEHAGMLELNPGDNQGMRYPLLHIYLALGRLEDARGLMNLHPSEVEYCAAFSWGHVLERHISGDEKGTRKALDNARSQNEYVESFLTGLERPPRKHEMPTSYSPGEYSEAMTYAKTLLMAWNRHPSALTILRDSPPGKGFPRIGPSDPISASPLAKKPKKSA